MARELATIGQIGNLYGLVSRWRSYAFFAQDSWRVTPKLSINYGLRAEQQYNPTPETTNTQIVNVVKNTIFPIRGKGYDPTDIPDSGWQWGPRVGFAFDPEGKGKMIIRGFAGQYFARTPLIVLAGSINNYRTPPRRRQHQLCRLRDLARPVSTRLWLGTAAGNAYRDYYWL